MLQLFLMRGLFEWDDVFSNTLGAVIGTALFILVRMLASEKLRMAVITSISLVFMMVCTGVYTHGCGVIGVEAETTSRAYCFQIDESEIEDSKAELNGVTFRYENPLSAPNRLLHSTETGESLSLNIDYGLLRTDVKDYFLCDRDYTNDGFTASGEVTGGEYEVIIQWPLSVSLSTGVFIDTSIHYAPEKEFIAPKFDTEYFERGVLRVYRPNFHCWVYQYHNDLYW